MENGVDYAIKCFILLTIDLFTFSNLFFVFVFVAVDFVKVDSVHASLPLVQSLCLSSTCC